MIAKQKATATIIGQGYQDLVEIEIGDDRIVATDQHPFWLLDDEEWVDAKDLYVGSALRTSAGTRVEILDSTGRSNSAG